MFLVIFVLIYVGIQFNVRKPLIKSLPMLVTKSCYKIIDFYKTRSCIFTSLIDLIGKPKKIEVWRTIVCIVSSGIFGEE